MTEVLSARRFGTGLAPGIAAPAGAEAMLSALAGADLAASDWPMAGWDTRLADVLAFGPLRRARRESEAANAAFQAHRRKMTANAFADLGTMIARGTRARDGFRERLAWFWADHFTVSSPRPQNRYALPAYIETAIRPRITGRFEDLLIAAVLHPAMVIYLDQDASVGPNSTFGAQREGRGLNENLAREVLELHTMGVGAGYGQRDVRALAELLTGLGLDRDLDVVFRPQRAEPGAETVLGQVFGGDPARLAHIEDALRHIARHPDTARHIARKLAVHFVADDPPVPLVEAVTGAFLATGGDLMAVYRALLEHPLAWAPEARKVQQPFAFLVAALRALGLGETAPEAGGRVLRETILAPLQGMAQPWMQAPGPDGWPEAAEAWVTPQGLAARIDWAMTQPERLLPALPDPRAFVEVALGAGASGAVRFAAEAAETRAAGIGLVLASAEFQRR